MNSIDGVASYLFDSKLRLESIIYLGGIEDPKEPAFAVQVHSFIKDLDWDKHVAETLKPDLPWIQEGLDHGRYCNNDTQVAGLEFFHDARDCGQWGFIFKVAHPVLNYYDAGTANESATCSWNDYRTSWFYGESLQEILPKVKAWADEMDRRDRAECMA